MTLYEPLIGPPAYGGPSGSGCIKSQPDDFVVEERLAFTPDGQGEHQFLYIEKVSENTEYVARLLARHAGVRQRDVSYAGLKDRHARTRQWFSVWLPGKADPDWHAIQSDTLQFLDITRHARKLKRGVLAGNRFSITVRDWQGDAQRLEQQLQAIQQHGFPNYFAEQRFGHNGQNLNKAVAMFAGNRVKPEQRSLYLSAVRAFLFNRVLAARISAGNWNQALSGDILQLDKTHSQFLALEIDTTLLQRLATGDIHPTGPLWGMGQSATQGEAQQLEATEMARHTDLVDGLVKAGLEHDRRALRVLPQHLHWAFQPNNHLQLHVTLPTGSYATALLKEIITST